MQSNFANDRCKGVSESGRIYPGYLQPKLQQPPSNIVLKRAREPPDTGANDGHGNVLPPFCA